MSMLGTVNAIAAPGSCASVNCSCHERHGSLSMSIHRYGIGRMKILFHGKRSVLSASTVESVVSTTNGVSFSTVPGSSGVDIVLSSGFLAFASHCGFLQAVTDVGLNVRGVMGTSSGALTGSLFAAGYSPTEISQEFSRLPPIDRIKLSKEPWKGVFSLDPATKRLRELLPATFDELEIDFGVGVVSKRYGYDIVDSGSLAEAVVASAAVPVLFNPVKIPSRNNTPHIDGGIKTRVGLEAWRAHQKRKLGIQPRPAAVHVVGRSSPFSGDDEVDTERTEDVALVLSPKSKSSLWDMSQFNHQMEYTYAAAVPVLQVFADQLHSENNS